MSPVELAERLPHAPRAWCPGTLACALCGGFALALGLLVYWTDRDPACASLIPGVAMLARRPVFGALGGWLPDLAHPFAFSLSASRCCQEGPGRRTAPAQRGSR
jgi:hypothetical protein